MHVDGAGVLGMKHTPYYPSAITSEPAGFNCLPIKNTFAKIHGFGRIIYQSYPTVEKQGANLIVEIVLRSLKTFLIQKKRTSVRNLAVLWTTPPSISVTQ